MEGEGKGDGHQHGRKPRITEPVPIAYKLTYSDKVRGHRAPTGTEPMEQWMDGWMQIINTIFLAMSKSNSFLSCIDDNVASKLNIYNIYIYIYYV